MDTTHKSSDNDNNETSSQNHKPPEQSPSTPPTSKKKYDIMKDAIFLTSPVYPPLISPKNLILTQRDDYLIPILSNETFTFKSQLTSLYMHPTDYTFKLYDKNQDFFTSIASNIMTPYHYWLDNNEKISHFGSIFTDRQSMISKLFLSSIFAKSNSSKNLCHIS